MKETSEITAKIVHIQKKRFRRIVKWIAVACLAAGTAALVMKPKKAY